MTVVYAWLILGWLLAVLAAYYERERHARLGLGERLGFFLAMMILWPVVLPFVGLYVAYYGPREAVRRLEQIENGNDPD